MKTDFPILVIGAGASGMMAAYAATRARPSCAVILEKEARAGRKLLATGNGRCNLYNARPEKARLHGSFAPAFERMLADTPPEALRAEFDRIGLCCREESEGRVYPYSGQASAVLDALRFACARQGAEIVPDARAAAITPERDGFVVESAAGTFRAKKVILAAGGCAAPSFGADGGGVRLLRALGHETAQERPSIAPLRVPAECIRGMKGIRLRGGVTLLAAGVPVQQESGELIFSDGTVSGVCVMQLARKAGELTARRKRVQLSIDLAPGLDTAALLRGRAALLGDEPAERLFTGLIPGRAAMCLLRAAEFDIELLENADAMRAAVPGFLAQSEIIALRKTKKGEAPCDIRPMIYNLLVTPEGHLRAVLALCETATCKPDLLLQALSDYAGLPEKPRTLIARTQLYGKQFAPLETL